MILIKNLDFNYAERAVFKDFSLSIPTGQFTVLQGPSGSGKTTLLHLLAGLLEPYGGSVTGAGERRAVVFQEDRLIPTMTAAENIRLAHKGIAPERTAELFEAAGLSGCENMYPAELSGGMRRRVAVLRALAFAGRGGSSVTVLMDEPFAGLDDAAKEQLAALIRRECEGKTLVVVSHDRTDAELLGAAVVSL